MKFRSINKLLKYYEGTDKKIESIKKFIKTYKIIAYNDSENLRGIYSKNMYNFLKNGEKSKKLHNIDAPYLDRGQVFKTKNNKKIFVWQPYHSLNDIKKECDEWAHINNLKIEYHDSSYSWHGDNSILIITYISSNEEISND